MATGLKHIGLVIGLLAAPLAADRPKTAASAPPKAFSDLLECRQIADPQARLSCYDARAGVLAEATQNRQIVVADRADVERTRKSLFGYALPVSPILGDDGEQAEVKRLDTTVASARRSRDGGWIIVLTGAGTWEQVDSKALPLSPRAGQKVVVTKGAIGSYFVSVDGQSALKMRRIQ